VKNVPFVLYTAQTKRMVLQASVFFGYISNGIVDNWENPQPL
jgi:hypothetical protein